MDFTPFLQFEDQKKNPFPTDFCFRKPQMELDSVTRFFENGSSTCARFETVANPNFSDPNLSKSPVFTAEKSSEVSNTGFPSVFSQDLFCHEYLNFFPGETGAVHVKQLLEMPKPNDFVSDKLKSPKCEEPYDLTICTVHHDENSTTGGFDGADRMLMPFSMANQVNLMDGRDGNISPIGSSQKRRRPTNCSDPLAVRVLYPPNVRPQCMLAAQRRKTMSDRTRVLEKLMPWERKMDTATLLEESYKYVRFLEAQVSALQGMPVRSDLGMFGPEQGHGPILKCGGLEKLDRQQLLQVMLNSERVKEKLYSSGCCIFSLEQTAAMKTICRLQDSYAER